MQSNNLFANAVSTDPATGTTTGVFVTREKGGGPPRDSIFVIISGPTGFSFVGGVLPKNALGINKKSADVDVAVSEIAVTSSSGDIPADGVISVSWDGDKVTKTKGDVTFPIGNGTVRIHGQHTSADADVAGSVFGTQLVDGTGDISTAHDHTQIRIDTP